MYSFLLIAELVAKVNVVRDNMDVSTTRWSDMTKITTMMSILPTGNNAIHNKTLVPEAGSIELSIAPGGIKSGHPSAEIFTGWSQNQIPVVPNEADERSFSQAVGCSLLYLPMARMISGSLSIPSGLSPVPFATLVRLSVGDLLSHATEPRHYPSLFAHLSSLEAKRQPVPRYRLILKLLSLLLSIFQPDYLLLL
ncbi:uncharacterized protein BKA55DRAFT_544496 [Fusarium redolens]|uniref:Uncharacterized protein n=1 Tax=Fusarium redolens TaxID=48865 RepID=A0A9P9G6D5_FUSRE|nr:uncharacterized protein BKA55DRAFT_544496 [Fusarium redolens]KAH7232149.1 hypothetical protein BKA55DRAFT_544496 [Fusarium redolens]